jgi:hypothetical protein
MRVCKNDITSYLAINVPITETSWSGGSVYNYGDEVRDGNFVYAYSGINGTNTVESPSNNSLSWVEVRPINQYAMLDGKSKTQTIVESPLIFEVTMNNYDTTAIMNLEAESLLIEIVDKVTDEVYYTEDVELTDDTNIIDFYEYCFADFIIKNYFYTQKLPLFGSNTKLRLTITSEELVKVGRLVIGKSFYIGEVSWGASLGLESYSIKTTDEFGNEYYEQRGAVELNNYEIRAGTASIPNLRRKAIEYDAIPILFVGDESDDSILENLLTFGTWQNLNFNLANPTNSNIPLTIKGSL